MITRAYALYQGCTYLLYCCWYIYTYVLLHACILHANLLTSCQYMLMYTMFWFFVTYSIGDLRVGWLLLMSIFLKKILLVWFRGHFVDFLFYFIDPQNTITKKNCTKWRLPCNSGNFETYVSALAYYNKVKKFVYDTRL